MEAQELIDRLTKILVQNDPNNTVLDMQEDLREAFSAFMESYSRIIAEDKRESIAECRISAVFCQAFWVGHDYALDHGQLRGD